jgi:hypothetical protein
MRSVLISAFLTCRGLIQSRIALHLELLALHHQLQVLQRAQPHSLLEGLTDASGSGCRESGRTGGRCSSSFSERIWLVTFMRCDLGDLDDETCRLEPIDNPFAPKLSPMSPAGMKCYLCLRNRPSGKWLLRLDSNQQPSG